VMINEPKYWQKYYHGDVASQRLARKYSQSDRLRYYWANPRVQFAFEQLMKNLAGKQIPLTLISQYMPSQWEKIRNGILESTPGAVLLDKVAVVLETYAFAQG
jgi:D-tagatose-1,6-bisphosphate aldolase subunit GatZ/KbaZ